MGFIGGAISAFQGNPSYSGVDVTKNPAIQGQINSLLGSYGTTAQSGASALQDYIKQYTAGNAAAGANTAQEIGSVDRYYNGAVDNALAGMRAQRQSAVLAAANRSSQAALAGIHGNMLAGQGGGSSYDSRLALKSYGDYATQAALDNANQTRSDYGFLLGQQQANLGVRNRLSDALAGRALVPYQARQSMFASNLGNLGGIEGLDQGNNIYGVQQNKTTADQFAQFANAADQGIMNGVSVAGSIMGMMGGGMGGGGGGGGSSSNIGAQYAQAQAPYQASGFSGGASPYQFPAMGMSAYPSSDYYDSSSPSPYGYAPSNSSSTTTDPYGTSAASDAYPTNYAYSPYGSLGDLGAGFGGGAMA